MKTKKPPDIIGDYFKCTKLSLKHVLKNSDITPFSVKSGTPKTPKRYNRTHKGLIILDPRN